MLVHLIVVLIAFNMISPKWAKLRQNHHLQIPALSPPVFLAQLHSCFENSIHQPSSARRDHRDEHMIWRCRRTHAYDAKLVLSACPTCQTALMRRVQLQQNHHDRVSNYSTRMSPSSVRPDRVCIAGEVHHTLVMHYSPKLASCRST